MDAELFVIELMQLILSEKVIQNEELISEIHALGENVSDVVVDEASFIKII